MAGTNSDYTENKAVDHILGTTAWTLPAAVSLALFTTSPNFETGAGGTEATGGSYARKAIAFTASSGGTTSNTAAKVWTVGTDIAAGTYVGYGVYDAATGLYYIGIMMTATTIITTKGGTAKTGSQLAGTAPILHGASTTGLTTSMPDPAAAITVGTASIYAAVS